MPHWPDQRRPHRHRSPERPDTSTGYVAGRGRHALMPTRAHADVRSAGQQGGPMRDAVVFRGVPNHPESAACSTGTAVSVGSPVLTAQATWASGRIRRASAGRWLVSAAWMSRGAASLGRSRAAPSGERGRGGRAARCACPLLLFAVAVIHSTSRRYRSAPRRVDDFGLVKQNRWTSPNPSTSASRRSPATPSGRRDLNLRPRRPR